MKSPPAAAGMATLAPSMKAVEEVMPMDSDETEEDLYAGLNALQ